MKCVIGVLAVAVLLLAAGLDATPARAACGKACQLILTILTLGAILAAAPVAAAGPKGCKKGTPCRQVIEAGYKSCQTAIRNCGTFCCPNGYPICGDDGLCHQPATTTTIFLGCPAPTTTIPSQTGCVNSGDPCSTSGCLGLPAGGCSYRCPAHTEFACIGFVSTYSTCNSDGDCPPDDPICVGRGFEDTCTPPGGVCAQPCR
jgi:hypothetical protein